MKLLGAVLLVASGLLAGLAGAARLKRRARLLLDLKTLLQAFQTGIRYAAESLAGLVLENQASRFCRLAERDKPQVELHVPWLLEQSAACPLQGAGRVAEELAVPLRQAAKPALTPPGKGTVMEKFHRVGIFSKRNSRLSDFGQVGRAFALQDGHALGHFQRVADAAAQRLVHIGDERRDLAPVRRADGDHLARKLDGVVERFHKRAVAHRHIQQDGV